MSSISHRGQSAKHLLIAMVMVVMLASFLLASLPAVRAQSGPQALLQAVGVSFNSQFNGTKPGWAAVNGAWALKLDKFYQGRSPNVGWGSTAHTGTYTNFVYTVKMRRLTGSAANALIVRGDPTLATSFAWDDGYYLSYGDSGHVAAHKRVNDSQTELLGWQDNAAVVSHGWNVLKVVMYGPALLYYVNGTLVFKYLDASPIASGQVGIGLANFLTDDKLRVDWAKLTVISADENPFTDAFTTFSPPGDARVVSPYEALAP